MQHAGDEGLIRNAFLQGTLLKAREVFARDANVDSTIFAERRSGILLVARDLLRLLVNRLPLSILCRLLELTLDFIQLLWHHIIWTAPRSRTSGVIGSCYAKSDGISSLADRAAPTIPASLRISAGTTGAEVVR